MRACAAARIARVLAVLSVSACGGAAPVGAPGWRLPVIAAPESGAVTTAPVRTSTRGGTANGATRNQTEDSASPFTAVLQCRAFWGNARAPSSITMELVEGPFRKLHGLWQFKPMANGGCQIEFRLEYEFTNFLLGLAAGKLMAQLVNEQVDAVCRRAQTLYGGQSSARR